MGNKISTQAPFEIPKDKKDVKIFLQEIPKTPGVYKFLSKFKTPLYIGKAKYLNNRVSSYFRSSSRSKKIEKLLQEAEYLEFSLMNTELESLLHEQFLIKEHKPKYNVQFKDDKGYPWIKIEIDNLYPAARSFLGRKDKKNKFFGPFPNTYSVRDTLKLIQKTFKLRNCSDTYFKNRTRPCLQYEIGRCSAPCVGFISKKDYQAEVGGAELLLSGRSDELITEFYDLMDTFSHKKDYEKAAIYRDRISALRDVQRSQSIAGFRKNRDAIYLTIIRGKIKIGISSVKQGWLTGHKNFILDDDFVDTNILEKFIGQYYLSNQICPSVLVVGSRLIGKSLLEEALSNFHSKNISIITKPGKKDKGLLDLCKSNTEYVLEKDKNFNNINSKMDALRTELGLKDKIKIIESYDISHHSGENAVGGCVVYSTRGKSKHLYRTYNITKKYAGNDIGAMKELLTRRFTSFEEKDLPSLIIIDGGRTHLKAVLNKLEELNIHNCKVISISKGVRRKKTFDSIHIEKDRIIHVKEGSLSHLFIQEIRDETHRFAITALKKKRVKSSMKSSIDSLIGVGPKRKKILLRYFGSFEQLKRASINDIIDISGIGQETAKSVYRQLHS